MPSAVGNGFLVTMTGVVDFYALAEYGVADVADFAHMDLLAILLKTQYLERYLWGIGFGQQRIAHPALSHRFLPRLPRSKGVSIIVR